MINLLPPAQKERLKTQGLLRIVLILGILFLSFLFVLFLVLLLVKSYIITDSETQKIILEERKKIISLNQKVEEEIEEANILLSNLNSFYKNNVDLTQLLEEIYNSLPSGTYLTEFSFSIAKRSRGEEQLRVSLSGYCPDRETLLKFKENLEKEKTISEVYFSPVSWVKPIEIDFTVNFVFNQSL